MTTNRWHHARIAGGLFGLLLLAMPSPAGGRWLHVRVSDHDHRGEQVSLNLPVTMVSSLLPMVEDDDLNDGRIELDDWIDEDLDGIDLREVLEALRDAPDADFVTVRSRDGEARVAKRDGMLIVRAEERDQDGQVRITVPLEVVDALLVEDPRRLDLGAALERLADYDGGDLVTVESEETTVRIWIDDSESGR